jgi:hypothetical protein
MGYGLEIERPYRIPKETDGELNPVHKGDDPYAYEESKGCFAGRVETRKQDSKGLELRFPHGEDS